MKNKISIYQKIETLIKEVKGNENLSKYGKLTMNPNTWKNLSQELLEDEQKMNSVSKAGLTCLAIPPYRYKGFEVVLKKEHPTNRLTISCE